MAGKVYKPTSRLVKWEEITAPEVRLFLAVLVYQGLMYKLREHLLYKKARQIWTQSICIV